MNDSGWSKRYKALDIDQISFGAKLDELGMMPLSSVDQDGYEITTQLTEKYAQQIINHLVDVFHIDATDIQVLYFPSGSNHIEILEKKLVLLRNLEQG